MNYTSEAEIEDAVVTQDVELSNLNEIKTKKQSKIEPGSVVAMDYDLGHYPFFGYGKKGFCGTKEVPFYGGKWLMESVEHPILTDIDVLLGVLKLVEDRVFKNEIENGKTTDELIKEFPSITIYTSENELIKYSGKSRGDSTAKVVHEALHRLFLFSATRKCDNGEVRAFRFLTEYKINKTDKIVGRKNSIKLAISLSFLDHCQIFNRILIHWREMQKLNTQLEKGLFLFLETNRRPIVFENRLLKILGVSAPTKPEKGSSRVERNIYNERLMAYKARKSDVVRDLLEKTIPSLAKGGLIENFDKIYHTKVSKKGKKFYVIKKTYLDN